VRPHGAGGRDARPPGTSARCVVARGLRRARARGRPRRADRRRHGRLGRRRTPRARDDRLASASSVVDRGRLRASRVGGPRHAGAVRQLLGDDRGDPVVLRPRWRSRHSARRGDDGRSAGRGGARRRRARDPVARRVPAACCGRLCAGVGAGGRHVVRRRAVAARRDRGRRGTRRAACRGMGSRRAR
jgi:hypothetical protein